MTIKLKNNLPRPCTCGDSPLPELLYSPCGNEGKVLRYGFVTETHDYYTVQEYLYLKRFMEEQEPSWTVQILELTYWAYTGKVTIKEIKYNEK